MATTVEHPPATMTSPPEQRIILHGVSWETYERLLAEHVDRGTPRFTYDRGELEIVAPSAEHEEDNRALAEVVVVVAEEWAIDFRNVGGMTYRREDVARGFEPDSSFYLQNQARVRGRRPIDLTVDPPPDLVIEIDVSHTSLHKFPIHEAMGVPEIWRYDGARVSIHLLGPDGYEESRISAALPNLTGDVLTGFVVQGQTLSGLPWLRAVREWARAHRPTQR